MQNYELSIAQLPIEALTSRPRLQSSIDDRQSVNLQSATCNLQ